jgi:MFS family permease
MKINRNSTLNLLFVIFIFFGIASTLIDPLIPVISEQLNIGFDRIGLILFAGSALSLAATFLAGRFSDKYDIKKIILGGLILLAIGFFAYGIYLSIIFLIITVVFFRVGYGILDSSIHAYVSKLYFGDHSPIFIRLDFFWYVGAIIGPLVISLLLFFKIEPKWAFLFFAFATLIVIVFFYISYRSVQKGRSEKNAEDTRIIDEDPENNSINSDKSKTTYLIILKNPIIILVCTGLFFYIGIFSILSTWLTTYFADFNIPVSFGSAVLSVFWAFNALGVFLTGKLIKRSNEKSLIIIYSIIGFISAAAYSMIPFVYVKIIFLIFQAVFFSSFFPLLNAIAVHEDVKLSGTILGITISVAIMGLVIFQPLTGFIVEYFDVEGINYLLIATALGSLVTTIILYRLVSIKYKIPFQFFNYSLKR